MSKQKSLKKLDGDLEINDCWECSEMSTTAGSGPLEPMCSYGLDWGWGISGTIVTEEELPFPDRCPLSDANAPEEVEGGS